MARRSMAMIAIAALCTVVALFALSWGLLPLARGPIPWTLVSVAPDARTLTILHELPHCETRAGKATVQETPSSVEITVPARRNPSIGFSTACTADLRMGNEEVRLSAPLGRRRLTGPSGPSPIPSDTPRPDECGRLSGLPVAAPALDVPWVAKRVRECTAPLPPTTLPLLERRRAPGDELQPSFTTALVDRGVILRPSESRRVVPGRALWLIPGPRLTCIGRLFSGRPVISSCAATRTLNRDGIVVPTTCVGDHTPTEIGLTGVVPAGVERVRLYPRRGPARTVAVRGGAWTARVAYPLRIAYGNVSIRTTYEFRTCFG